MNEEIHNLSQEEIVKLHLRIQTCLIACILVFVLMIFIFLAAGKVTVTLNTPVETVPEVTTESIPETTVEPIIPDNLEPIPDVTEVTATEETIPETIPEVTEAPVSNETVSTVNPDDLELLACVIYQEAGADYVCDDCRRRVADVVLNRVNSPDFPNTIREVLTARDQYGSYHWTGVVWPKRSGSEYEKHAVERAYRVAEEVLSGQHSALYGNGYVWQAGFKQGTEGFWCCNTYFGR